MSSRVLAVLALAAAAACGGKKESAAAPPPAAIPLAIFQDDKQIATTALLGAKPRPLVEVAPGLPAPDRWLAIVVFDAKGTATTAMAPSQNHPDAAAALAVGTDGVRFGFARGDQLDAPIAAVVKIVIKTHDDRGAVAAELKAQGTDQGAGDGEGGGHEHEGKKLPAPTAALTIAIKSPSGESVFTGDKLIGLPSITAPAGDMTTPGWNLVDLLKAAGLEGATAINLTDSEGANLRLDRADFDPATTVLYFKVNRNGQIRFRRFGKQGAAWTMTGELRGLTRIAVVE